MYARTRRLPTKPALPAWKWALAISMVVLLMVGIWRIVTWPRNPATQAAATRRTVVQDWSTLKRFGPRPVGTPGHDQAVAWLEDQFTALGYRVTRQPVTLERPFDQGGTVKVGNLSVSAAAIYGAGGGEQTGRLVRVSPAASRADMEAAGLRGQLALVALEGASCDAVSWRDLADRSIAAGAFGLVLVNNCPVQQLKRIAATSLPLVMISGAEGLKVLGLAGQTATVTCNVELREVTGHNLIAARVSATPEIVFGAHLDSVNDSPGANDNASGVLAVVDLARRAVNTPLAERAWFVLFDAEEYGLHGSSIFARDPSYPIRKTRAMLNMDMVGVAAEPLGVAGDVEVLALARQIRPDLRVFKDDGQPRRVTFGRTSNVQGSSDHVSFMRWGVPTAFLYRGEDINYHSAKDITLDLVMVKDTAAFAAELANRVLDAPWTPREMCDGGQNCRK
ncbi:M28 family metallopeptidase [Deinococcus humi]|uniref:Aminopeptidase YwaD n=1 Tax=Deinococcus humi TaxID=662880 RepID=A0A7W8JXV0_9DEIO|nr:M28 family peptidase [Deinococcus humi]MBB5365227.1 aminopeptidase YwaD [Deinococcus humi]GGO35677.1 aminopeptidase [Deinococcus humi]